MKKARSEQYFTKTITDTDYADDLALLVNTSAQVESQLHSQEQVAGSISIPNKTEFMCFKQKGAISTLSSKPLKSVDKFTYFGSNISSTESDINTHLAKAWNTAERLLIIWKSELSNKIKRDFFQTEAVSKLLYGCTTWTLTKCREKNLDGN